MKTNWFRKYTLPGMLAILLAMANIAVAQPTPWVFSGNTPIFAGQTGAGTGGTYDIGSLNVVGNPTGSTAGFATNDAAGTFNLNSTITVSGTTMIGSNYENIGFLYVANGPGPSFATFTGSINGGNSTINVSATRGSAYGAFFGNVDTTTVPSSWVGYTSINTTSGITFGDIIVKTTDTSGNTDISGNISVGAAGFVAGTLEGGNVSIQSITADSTLGWALGVQLASIDTGSTIKVGNMNILSREVGEAIGFKILGAAGGTLSAGSITVTAQGGRAIGIFVGYGSGGGGADNIHLNGDITATGGGSDTSGIRIMGATSITLENNVQISANYTGGGTWTGAGIWTDGNLDIDLNDKDLTTNSVKVDNANTLNVFGKGRADLGIVQANGNVTIGNGISRTTAIIDIVHSQLGGINTIANQAFLKVYGDTNDPGWTPVDFDVPNANSDSIFQNIAIFTNWGMNIANNAGTFTGTIWHNGYRSAACMSDGFVAAFGIHKRNAAWNMVSDRMISGSGRCCMNHHSRQGYYGQSPCDPDPCAPVMPCDPCRPLKAVSGRGAEAWFNYINRSEDFGSSYNRNRGWALSMDGVQAGTDLCRDQSNQFGILFGYETGDMTNVRDRIEADDVYAGLYMAHVFRGGADIRGVLAYGWQEFDMRRGGNGGYIYESTFKGNTFEGNLEFGKRFSRGRLSVRPVFAADVLNNNLKGTTEREIYRDINAREAVKYGKSSLTQVFLRTGAELQCRMDFLTLNGGLFYAYDVRGQELRTRATLERNPSISSPLVGAKLGKSVLSYNFGGSCQVTQCLSVIGGYQGEYVFDRSGKGASNAAYIGGAWMW